MAIVQLNEEQVKHWSRQQKDQWWLDHIYQGNMAQLSWRSGITGFLLGGILSSTAMYIGAKTGISIGVNLISVILAFGLFKAFENLGLAKNFTILENNCTQSIATSAGYMTMPLVACLPAYMMITKRIPEWWHMLIWMVIIAILGVLLAFPLKRRFINEDQLPFPEGNACGVVLDTLYNGDAASGIFKAKLLAKVGLWTAALQIVLSDGWMKLLQFKILRLDQWASWSEPWYLKERLDTYYYLAAVKFDWWIPKILGVDFRTLGLRFTLDAAMLGVGALMGIRVATSCLIGALLNFAILGPWMIQRGEIAPRMGLDGKLVPLSRIEILNQWSLWWGIVIMVVAALISLFAKPDIFKGLTRLLKRNEASDQHRDVLAHIEVPLWISYWGIPIFSLLGVWASHHFFGVPWLFAFISLALVYLLTVICINSMALTSWIPTSGLSKITQFSMGALDRSNPATNLIPAGMSAEVASSAASLLSDIKPGYMLGAKPRHQVLGHLIGIFSGTLACIPVYFLLFLPPDANGLRDTTTIVSDQFAFPAATQWKGVAELIGHGFSNLSDSVIISIVIAALAAIVFELASIVSKARFPLSAISIGLGVVLPPESVLAMWIGAFVFWMMERKYRQQATDSIGYRVWIDGMQAVAAGLLAGSALIGIGNAMLNVLM
ncbi:OPT family oligopeptide transporter [Undibacterium fentianense]|uniref:OPT/YSL family transporter n=1 Tax=Undibacterium fentianense TaxID=2828728 RepID=A0A941E5I5_9BURK|nr:OPT family oligopeptide transporter [Undibacterium fentianense]MBR7800098.1 OPT/YSL family transporter [Undibacterium fentianense]